MKLKICVSDRCFFPKSAFMSSKAVVKLAKSLGYKQVEFHPTWAVWFEALTKGKLSCQSGDISSFHISWREDGRNMGFGFFKRNFLTPTYWIFPPESLGIKTLQRLERKHRKPVVIHWQEDFARFRSPLLELHGPLGMNRRQIEKEVRKGRIKGVLIDTDKFSDWLRGMGERENQSLRRLFPYIREVHFRFRYKEDVELLSGGRGTKSVELMKKLVEMGYKGKVIVEMGWPDPGSIEVLRQEGQDVVHQRIVEFLKNL